MYCRLSYVSRGVLPLKTPAPLYICTFIKQYNNLTFSDTPLSNFNITKLYQYIFIVVGTRAWSLIFKKHKNVRHILARCGAALETGKTMILEHTSRSQMP
jgi:hypothetical protein